MGGREQLHAAAFSVSIHWIGVLGGTNNLFRCCGEEENVVSLIEIKFQSLGHPALSLVFVPTELSWL
jgi:hypothetical protein